MLTIPCEQLVEGENKDQFCGSHTFRARRSLFKMWSCGYLRSQRKFPSTLLAIIMSAKLGPWHCIDTTSNARVN